MSESLEHQKYVKRIVEYVRHIVPSETYDKICADLPDYVKPSLAYDSYIPDVLYSYKGTLIVGEAKTYDDYNREHSRKQYEAYIRECKNYPGDSIVVIAVPWQLFVTAKNHFVLLKRKYDVDTKIVVISENGTNEVV